MSYLCLFATKSYINWLWTPSNTDKTLAHVLCVFVPIKRFIIVIHLPFCTLPKKALLPRQQAPISTGLDCPVGAMVHPPLFQDCPSIPLHLKVCTIYLFHCLRWGGAAPLTLH